MTSLLHAIERRILNLGGSNIIVRGQGSGSGKLVISFVYKGEPRSAVMNMPSKRQGMENRRHACKDAIERAIR